MPGRGRDIERRNLIMDIAAFTDMAGMRIGRKLSNGILKRHGREIAME